MCINIEIQKVKDAWKTLPREMEMIGNFLIIYFLYLFFEYNQNFPAFDSKCIKRSTANIKQAKDLRLQRCTRYTYDKADATEGYCNPNVTHYIGVDLLNDLYMLTGSVNFTIKEF